MPNNLTDAEIKKALEICSTYKGKCTDCPAFVKVDRSNCKKVLWGAIEIINRLQADLIDKEKQIQEALKSMAVNKTKVIDCEKEINRQKAEIDYWKRNVFDGCMERGRIEKTAKAEAYKECLLRVKKLWGKYRGYDFEIKLDNLLKEMVGDNV
jgi:hypothetical protein